MPDNLNIRRPADAKRINLNEPWEIQYWSKALDVTPERLRQSVQAVGTMVDDVKRHLKIQ